MAYKLSDLAEQDLRDIYEYGYFRFGERQAVDYFHKLHFVFDRIDLSPTISRLRSNFTPPIRVHAFHAHVILYTIQEPDIYIYRVFHGAANWHETFKVQE